MARTKEEALIDNLLVALEDLVVEHYKGKPLPVDIAELLLSGREFLGDTNYKAPDPTKICEVCGSDLDNLEIICGFCFKEAFTDDLEYDEEDGSEEDPPYPERYKYKRYLQFVADMWGSGIPLHHYNGRNYYKGPAVYTNEELSPSKIYSLTEVVCKEDNMGRNYVIYPK